MIEDFERGVSYTTADIKGGDILLLNLACIDKQGYYREGELKNFGGDFSDNHVVYPGDMLIACTDLTRNADIVGTPIWVPQGDFYLYTMDLAKLTPKKNVDKSWLYYALKTPSYRNYIKKWASGSNVLHLNLKGVYEYIIDVPPIEQQRRIGKLLSDIDRKIALNRRMNATLEAMARQLYDYWFLQFDFPDAHGKPYKSSGGKMTWNNKLKRDIPEGWEVIPLEKLCRINNETITKDTTLKIIDYLDTSSITRNNITNVERLLLCEAPSRAQRKVADLTILYSTVRPRLEHHGILCNPSKNMIVSTGFATIDANKKEFAPYIYSFLKSPKIVEYLANLAETAVSSYPSITPKDIASLNVLVPANAIIERFSEIIEESYRITASNQKKISTLTRLRTTLLPLLMNGQVSVEEPQ